MYTFRTLNRLLSVAVRARSRNGVLVAVETCMSPLALAQRLQKRKHRLNEAQMAHLRQTAYRGVNTTAHQAPTSQFEQTICVQRGISYIS